MNQKTFARDIIAIKLREKRNAASQLNRWEMKLN